MIILRPLVVLPGVLVAACGGKSAQVSAPDSDPAVAEQVAADQPLTCDGAGAGIAAFYGTYADPDAAPQFSLFDLAERQRWVEFADGGKFVDRSAEEQAAYPQRVSQACGEDGWDASIIECFATLPQQATAQRAALDDELAQGEKAEMSPDSAAYLLDTKLRAIAEACYDQLSNAQHILLDASLQGPEARAKAIELRDRASGE